ACGSAERRRRTCSPILRDPVKIDPTGMTPNTRYWAIAARPTEAVHPQLLQSGMPPNWHGVIFVVKSAEMLLVMRAKTQSFGDSGGGANNSISSFGSVSLG